MDGGALDSLHLLEYSLVSLVILASVGLTFRLLRKGIRSKRRDMGPLLGLPSAYWAAHGMLHHTTVT